MKSRKLTLLLPMLAIIFLVWVIAVFSINNDEEAELIAKQTIMVEKADAFLEDEIYIRAIPLYEEACTISTSATFDITYKLGKAYYNSGDIKSYYKMLIYRCGLNNYTALEEEFAILAEYYFETSDYSSAMNTLNKGIAAYNSEALKKLKKEHTYDFYDASGYYSDMVITATDYIPVSIGEKWAYINSRGGKIGKFIYDTATPYMNVYKYDNETRLEETVCCAMVTVNGVHQAVNTKGQRYSLCKEDISEIIGFQKSGYGLVKKNNGKYAFVNSDLCVISDEYDFVGVNSDGMYMYTSGGKAGALNNSCQVVINAEYDDFAVNSYGEAFNSGRSFSMKSGKYTMIDYTGNIIGTETYDDAHGFYYGSTLAAVCKNGKWGFIDDSGNAVIDYQFENAKSFSNNLAAVCKNGKWGYINTSGEVVINYQFDDAFPFNKYGTAQVYTVEGYKLIRLNWINNEV